MTLLTPRPPVGRPSPAGALDALLKGYAPPPGGHDEMMGPDGQIRPHYRPLVQALAAMSAAERETRFASAAQHLREAGVFYRLYGAGDQGEAERGWPLAHPPLIIAKDEWAALERGLVQRAEFLERLMGDLYGRRDLLRTGALPGAVLGRNPEFLRPLADQAKSGRPLIRFIAVDLGRGPDGRWWVLGDRTQAPSGAGFALENRVATARAFPDLSRTLKVQRLASFFQRFREALYGLDETNGARIGVLTPGPLNDTYFEHAYLARYLGFLLLEGGDLVVHGNAAEVRTVDGSKPIRVLWRRLDGDFADPLELYSKSRIGTPGIVRAVRSGTVEMVNALGSGILETRALLAFQPALARALLGAELLLPTIATWWGGQAAERAYLAKHRDRLSLADAFPPASDSERHKPLDLGIRATAPERLVDDLGFDGASVVGQEHVGLSTAPMVVDGRLEARPVTLRVFLARDDSGWHVMPGGFARVSNSTDPLAVSMQAGGHSVDVWVTSDDAEERPVSLLADKDERFLRRLPGALPARAADNLFWLGRYVERAEVATRLTRLYAIRQGESDREGLLEQRVAKLLTGLGVDVAGGKPALGLLKLTRSSLDIASRIRDRFSPDGWRVLSEIVERVEAQAKRPKSGDVIALTSEMLTRLAGFSGLVQENMYQFTGWRFLQAGRGIERGMMTAKIAAALTSDKTPEGALEALLEFTDSGVTYRRRYSVALSLETVLDLTVLDPLNPRSVAFQVNGFQEVLEELPGAQKGETLDMLARRIARLKVRIATGGAAEVTEPFLTRIVDDFAMMSTLLSQRYFAATPRPGMDRLETE